MEFQELTPQEMEQVNGGTLCLLGGLVGGVVGVVGGLLGNCHDSCDPCGGGIDVKVKVSIGLCL